jgi:hypothetical protein
MKEPTTTLQQLERTANDPNTTQDRHPIEWLAAFKAQATQELMDDVVAYVAKRATWIRERQGRAADNVIGSLVVDALGDTFSGVVAWDPMRCPLALHLKSVIRSRLSHELERAEDYQHVDIDQAPQHEVNEALVRAGKASPTKKLSAYVKEFTARLRGAAADDLAVLTLIDCYLDDITERAQICHASGMKPSVYHNAFRRLKRLADKLPQDLRAAALADLA